MLLRLDSRAYRTQATKLQATFRRHRTGRSDESSGRSFKTEGSALNPPVGSQRVDVMSAVVSNQAGTRGVASRRRLQDGDESEQAQLLTRETCAVSISTKAHDGAPHQAPSLFAQLRTNFQHCITPPTMQIHEVEPKTEQNKSDV